MEEYTQRWWKNHLKGLEVMVSENSVFFFFFFSVSQETSSLWDIVLSMQKFVNSVVENNSRLNIVSH